MLLRLLEPGSTQIRCFVARLVLGGGVVNALLGSMGCGDRFDAAQSSGGSAGRSNPANLAGAAGEDESAGEGGAPAGEGGTSGGGASSGTGGGGTAGTGGKSNAGCNCAIGSYCQEGTKLCKKCSVFSQSFEFSAPQKLATLSQTQAGNERFPRGAGVGPDLFYRSGPEATPAIWYATAPVSGSGRSLSAAGAIDSGPLYAPRLFPQINFFFDEANAVTKVRQILIGSFADGQLTNVAAAPEPINGLNSGGDFGVAVAADVRRAYWMSSRNKNPAPDLLFVNISAAVGTPAIVNLQVQAGASKCPRLGNDATAWVNPSGTLMLFRSQSMDEKCMANDAGAYDLFAVPLGEDGLPQQAAIALGDLNVTGGGSSETDPSLSLDLCTIYFASDGGKGDFDLYRAERR